MSKAKCIGTFWPDQDDVVINDAPCGAVLVHPKAGFNDDWVIGAIQIVGIEDEGAINGDPEGAPQWLDPTGARKLAALLLKAADAADAIKEAAR